MRRHAHTVSSQPLIALILLCGVLFFFRLGARDLNSSHEARAAQNAQYMIERGDWSIPTLFNNRLDLQKPPLFYWIVAFLSWFNGGEVDPWMVRLPAAFSALSCVLLVFYLGHYLGQSRVGLFAASILATSLHFTWLARVGRIDMPFTFALTLAIGSALIAMKRRTEGGNAIAWSLLSYISVALAALLKGPLALMLFPLWQASFWFRNRRFNVDGLDAKTATWGSWWWGYPLVCLLVAPWFVWANWKTENKLWEVFICYHNVQRGMGGSENLSSYPFWYYVPRLAIDLLPWSLLLPWAMWCFWRGKVRPSMLAREGFAWFAVYFVFFSLMSFKRADYLLPLFPAIALFLAAMLDDYLRQRAVAIPQQRAPWPFEWSEKQVYSLASVTCLAWLLYLGMLDSESRLGWVWQKQARDIRANTDRPIIFFRTEAHALAFHVGRPLDTILEWENLDIWASERGLIFFVMPPDCADQWPAHLHKGRLIEYARIHDAERPLVILHSEPLPQR